MPVEAAGSISLPSCMRVDMSSHSMSVPFGQFEVLKTVSGSLALSTVLLHKLIFSCIYRKADRPVNILLCGICGHFHSDLLSRCLCAPQMKLTPDKAEVLLELTTVCPFFELPAPVCLFQLSWWFQSKAAKGSL